jgi:hypothetical protein
MGVSARFGAKAPGFLACAALVMVVMTSCSITPAAVSSSTPAVPANTSSAPTFKAPDAAGSGLVTPVHARCDVGNKILHYLATGDNGGDPQLDVVLSKDVGVSVPQARAIADQEIQQCDAAMSKQEASQASAAAQATAAASAAAAAEQKKADVQATQTKSCAAIGGKVDPDWGWCASTVPGNPSGKPGSDCKYANVAFNPDGTLATWSSSTTKDFYPGCFQL